MEITNATTLSSSSYQTAVEQESLSNDDFMQLLLTELKYQDPTKPMDTKAMIDQTMQMSTIEANNANAKAMVDMQNSFASTQMLNSVNLIGKHIDTGDRSINLSSASSTFSVLFDQDVSTGIITIKDANGTTVNTLDISGVNAGETTFNWDGKDSSDIQLNDGTYTLEVQALNSSGQDIDANIGTYLVSALEFNDGDITVVANDYKINLNNVTKIW